jgi:hypothetical protein
MRVSINQGLVPDSRWIRHQLTGGFIRLLRAALPGQVDVPVGKCEIVMVNQSDRLATANLHSL